MIEFAAALVLSSREKKQSVSEAWRVSEEWGNEFLFPLNIPEQIRLNLDDDWNT